MKLGIACLLSLLAVLGFGPARAMDGGELFGTPVILDSGLIMLDGKQVALWGIETLTDDQKCWQEDRAWDCGEQAATALKHFVEGQLVKCQVKNELGDGGVCAQCFRVRGGKTNDIAQFLVLHGWAMDDGDISGNLYNQDQDQARRQRRGIWTSRFQTAADWREGVQRFVLYEMEPEPQIAPKIVNETTVNNNTTNVIIMGPHHKRKDTTHFLTPPNQVEGHEKGAPPMSSVPEASAPAPDQAAIPPRPGVPDNEKPTYQMGLIKPDSNMSEKERTSEILSKSSTEPNQNSLLPAR